MSSALKAPLAVEEDCGIIKSPCLLEPAAGNGEAPALQMAEKKPATAAVRKKSDMDAVGSVIAAFIKKNRESAHPVKTGQKVEPGFLRVAAYIRVSSENEDQEDSYELQEKYFSSLLAQNQDWVSAGIYSDYGISATSEKNRIGFMRLMRHCREGRIDRIIVKSISRFARNTVDFLEAMNLLKECGVSILFEKENMDTADAMGEFVLTVLAAIAQEESRSISSNIRWGQEARFPKGETANLAIYGYRIAEGNDAYETTESGYTRRRVEIVEEEAAVVRRIFQEVAAGERYTDVARNLNYDHIPAPPLKRTKRSRLKEGIDAGWTGARIRLIIRNERYCGDVKIRKTFTEDYLSHKAKVNKGERPQYYFQDHHPAIVGRELFHAAQSRKTCDSGANNTYPFSGQLICAQCGRTFSVRNRKHYPIWFCPSTTLNNGKAICHNDTVYEEQVVNAVRKGLRERFSRDFVADIRARLEHLQSSDFNESDRAMMKSRAQILLAERRNLERKRDLVQMRLEQQMARADAFGEGMEASEILAEEIAVLDLKLEGVAGKEEALRAENDHMEGYWMLLEKNYEWRADAIRWMKTLPDGREGIEVFLELLTAVYAKGFILSITVHDGRHFTIRWFDDISTDVEMYDEVKDHRFGHNYF